MNVIVFFMYVGLFLAFANWGTIRWLLIRLISPKKKIKSTLLTDQKIHTYLSQKTRLKYTIRILEADYFAGFSNRFFKIPLIYITRKVLKDFTWNELEWILLHEAGHAVLWHSYFLAIFQFFCGSLGLFLFLTIFDGKFLFLFPSVILAGILNFQLSKYTEQAADKFSVTKMNNPEGMITANQKMKAAGKSIIYKNSLLQILLTPHPSYDERMQMAEKEIERRGGQIASLLPRRQTSRSQ